MKKIIYILIGMACMVGCQSTQSVQSYRSTSSVKSGKGEIYDSREYVGGKVVGGNQSRTDILFDVEISTKLNGKKINVRCKKITREIKTMYNDISDGDQENPTDTYASLECELSKSMVLNSGGNIFSVEVTSFGLNQLGIKSKKIEDIKINDFSNMELTSAKVASSSERKKTLGKYGKFDPANILAFACDGFISYVGVRAKNDKVNVFYKHGRKKRWKFDGGLSFYPRTGKLRSITRRGGWTIGSQVRNALVWTFDHTKYFRQNGIAYGKSELPDKNLCALKQKK